ncbi:MAG: FecR domain-containing protein [Lentisphaerae bacterium]|nr:FecR domain-containing protein [Lentisphaerota bacterium]
MKGKSAYLLLIGGVFILLVVAAILSWLLFDLSIPEKTVSSRDTVQAPNLDTPVVGETVIVAKDPDMPQIDHKPAPQASKSQPAAGSVAQRKDVAKQPGIGRIEKITGRAFAVGQDKKRRQLMTGARVFLNDQIETAQGGRIDICFDDQSVISQGENSMIVLDEYVYDADKSEKCNFAMRFLRGTCRVVTGIITDVNPERFRVRTRMATIGIRGCDLSFKSVMDRDDIRILDLAGVKIVQVETTKHGEQVMNMLTGDPIDIPAAEKHTIIVNKPRTLVSMVRGKGATQHSMSLEEVRAAISETSANTPARYSIKQARDGAVMTLKPETPAQNATDEAQ